jgi:hypothetical protein
MERRRSSSSGGHQIRVRHDDLELGLYAPAVVVRRRAVTLATDVEDLTRRLRDRQGIRVADNGSVIGLRRIVRSALPRSGHANWMRRRSETRKTAWQVPIHEE